MAESFKGKEKHVHGGEERIANLNDDFLITQSHHLYGDDDFLYASQMIALNVRVIKADNGEFVRDIGEGGFGEGCFNVPGGAALLNKAEQQLVICDVNGGRVHVYETSGKFVKSFGSEGSGKGELDGPNDVAVDATGNIFVAEANNKRVQIFDSSFNHKAFIPGTCTVVSYDHVHNRILASDPDGNSVSLYSTDGQLLFSIKETGSDPGQITYPCGTAVDSKGNIFICDYVNERVQVFDENGKFISVFGDSIEFSYPEDIVISENGSIYVLDGSVFSGWNRVWVF